MWNVLYLEPKITNVASEGFISCSVVTSSVLWSWPSEGFRIPLPHFNKQAHVQQDMSSGWDTCPPRTVLCQIIMLHNIPLIFPWHVTHVQHNKNQMFVIQAGLISNSCPILSLEGWALFIVFIFPPLPAEGIDDFSSFKKSTVRSFLCYPVPCIDLPLIYIGYWAITLHVFSFS